VAQPLGTWRLAQFVLPCAGGFIEASGGNIWALVLKTERDLGGGVLIQKDDAKLAVISRAALAGRGLSEDTPFPKEMVLSGKSQHESGGYFKGAIRAGVYQAAPAKLSLNDYRADELMYVLSGSVIVTEKDGEAVRFVPGDCFVLRRGFEGTFEMIGAFRKLAVMAGSDDGVDWLVKSDSEGPQ